MQISALYRYPIKSCGGIAMATAALDARGIVGDRQFLVIDDAGTFLTQREHPRLALVAPASSADDLSVSTPGQPSWHGTPVIDGPRVAVTIWEDRCTGIDQGDAVAAWFSRFLGASCRLVRFAEDHARPVDPGFAVSGTDQVAFSDGYPLMVTTEASLADLNQRLAEPLPMNRFRPNVVIRGAAAYAEDGWRRLRLGSLGATAVKPCLRCQITTTNQTDATVGVEPLRTLRTYRFLSGQGVQFGVNLVHDGPGQLQVGDPVSSEA